jgi:hypothetical protein
MPRHLPFGHNQIALLLVSPDEQYGLVQKDPSARLSPFHHQ